MTLVNALLLVMSHAWVMTMNSSVEFNIHSVPLPYEDRLDRHRLRAKRRGRSCGGTPDGRMFIGQRFEHFGHRVISVR